MRRGYCAGGGLEPVRPIDIRYEDEDSIVEPLSRLDELGDKIDGEMSMQELDSWIARLSR